MAHVHASLKLWESNGKQLVPDISRGRNGGETWVGHSAIMLRLLDTWRATLADYTVGTVIVMVHMLTADRQAASPRHRLTP